MRILSAKLKEEDNSVLIVSVEGDDGKEEKELREYDIQGKKGNRYIEFEDGKYVLIERQGQIDEKLDAKDYDFSKYIFLCKADFKEGMFNGFADFKEALFIGDANFWRAMFSKGADFRGATFRGEANFWWATFDSCAGFAGVMFSGYANFRRSSFSEKANFENSSFIREANFQGATFGGEANFMNAKFSGESDFSIATFSGEANFYKGNFIGAADFGEARFRERVYFWESNFSGWANFWIATFSGEAVFMEAMFSKAADFKESTFSGGANFDYSTFGREAYFEHASISGSIDFSYAKFEKVFNFQGVKAGEGFSLNLLGTDIESMLYTGSDISKAESRETFLILKHQASKQQDTVRALEFYKKEMNLYREELKKDSKKADSWADKYILGFEHIASKYGTDPVRAMVWLVGINAIYIVACIILFYVPGDIPLVGFISNYSFNPFSILSDLKIDTIQGWRAVLVVLNFLKNILTAVLAYEIIKSFRKYSRRL